MSQDLRSQPSNCCSEREVRKMHIKMGFRFLYMPEFINRKKLLEVTLESLMKAQGIVIKLRSDL